MKRTISLVMSLVLLFVFAFSMVATIHSDTNASGMYSCCDIDVPDPGIDGHGVWYKGECHCGWTGANPYGCPDACPQPG